MLSARRSTALYRPIDSTLTWPHKPGTGFSAVTCMAASAARLAVWGFRRGGIAAGQAATISGIPAMFMFVRRFV
jgi:hypothetical protein